MSDLAQTYLRQARGFLHAGNPARALELLEAARTLAREDTELLIPILTELAAAADAVGKIDMADRARQAVARMGGNAAPVRTKTSAAPVRLGGSHGSNNVVWISAIAGVVVLIIVGFLLLWLMNRPAGAPAATVATTAPSTTPSNPATAAGPVVTSLPAVPNTALFPAIAATSPAPATLPAGWDRQRIYKDNVGMLVVMCRYEGRHNGRQMQMDLPIGTGTAFAITNDGVLLTNRHVVDAAEAGGKNTGAPATLASMGAPTLVLRSTTYMMCFGASAKEHYPAQVLQKSDKYDLAVVKIDRQFVSPLQISNRRIRQADDILVCGYPGVVADALVAANTTQTRMDEIARRWRTTGKVELLDVFTPDAFESTVTRGIISNPERRVRGVSYVQIDAAISPGNSGGPVFGADNEVIGIATWGIKSEDTGGIGSYNFALTMDQLKEEFETFLKPDNH